MNQATVSQPAIVGARLAELLRETTLARIALAVVAVHVLDDNFLQPQPEAHRPADSPIEINKGAPVVGAGEIEIAANPDVVWQVLTEIDRWPSWNPQVRSASLEGSLDEGSEFRWKAGPGTIRSTITQIDQPRKVAWTGRTFSIKAIHVYLLEPRDGTTLVKTQESYEGLVARVFRGQLQKTLDQALAEGLRHLKVEAERRPGA